MTSQEPGPAGPPESTGAGGPVRLRILLAYDGTAFCGWARQPGLRSVQGELEAALRDVLRVDQDRALRVAVAGRTDAGVHARGQVCHCDVPAGSLVPFCQPAYTGPGSPGAGFLGPRWPGRELALADRLVRRLNGRLSSDIRVHEVEVAPAGFDARWSAAWRRYAYRIATGPRIDPLTRNFVLWHPHPLDARAMTAAAHPLVGEHDFAAFCRRRPEASTVRTIRSLHFSTDADGSDRLALHDRLRMEIVADAFCHNMVRSLVGALIAVGEGRWPTDRPAALLAGGTRVPGAATAPAHGLCLEQVGYPPDEDLAAQAERARRYRG